jgi:hypothetical protein
MNSFLTLVDQSELCKPIVDSAVARVYPTVLQHDGTALKPGLQFDQRMKVIVGLKNEVDYNFIQENTEPTSNFIKNNLVTEALVMIQASLDGSMGVPIGLEYCGKSGKTGQIISNRVTEQAAFAQTCKWCMDFMGPNTGVLVERHILTHSYWNSLCNECWQNNEVCALCALTGKPASILSTSMFILY